MRIQLRLFLARFNDAIAAYSLARLETVMNNPGIPEAPILQRLGSSGSHSAGLDSWPQIRRRVSIVNLEAPRAHLEQGQSVLLVAAHQCNWEWMLLALSLELGYPVDAAYKPLVNNWAEREMKKLRTRFGSRLVPAQELLPDIIKRRDVVRAVAMVADQEPTNSERKYWTRFLNRDTAFYMGPEEIARSTRFAVFFIAMRRTARVCYPPVATTALGAIPGGLLMYALSAQILSDSRDQVAGLAMLDGSGHRRVLLAQRQMDRDRPERVTQESGSLAPMSMVISVTRPRWARRKLAAAASCEPPG